MSEQQHSVLGARQIAQAPPLIFWEMNGGLRFSEEDNIWEQLTAIGVPTLPPLPRLSDGSLVSPSKKTRARL